MLIGMPVRKMKTLTSEIAQNALKKPLSSAIDAPMASSARNEIAPSAVLATRNSLHLRKLCGV